MAFDTTKTRRMKKKRAASRVTLFTSIGRQIRDPLAQ
jgi:hypothetical protein